MKKGLWLIAGLFFIVLSAVDVHGQFFSRRKHYTWVGAGINAMHYYGELAPSNSTASFDFSFTRPNLSLEVGRRFHPRFSAKGTLSFGRLQGNDNVSQDVGDIDGGGFFRYARGLHFRNDIIEVAGFGVVDLYENRGTFLKRKQFIPYAFLGIGFIYHNPKAKTPDGDWVALRPLETEDKTYSRLQPVIPFGLGAKLKITNNLDIAAEISLRYTFTDFLDDVSGDYKDLEKFSDPLAAAMSNRSGESNDAQTGDARDMTALTNHYGGRQDLSDLPYTWKYQGQEPLTGITTGEVRGNPSNNDVYSVFGFRVTYILVKGIQTPKFR